MLFSFLLVPFEASASSYDWDTYPISPYVYYPFSGYIQNDNITYEFAVDAHLERYGNVPYADFIYEGTGPSAYATAYVVESPVEGTVSFTFPAFSVPTVNSTYPSSLPLVTVTGFEPTSAYRYGITYCFAEYSSSTDSFTVSSAVHMYQLELPEFDIEEAYSRFLNGYDGESPVFPPDDRVCIVTGISVEFDAVNTCNINFQYPSATDILDGFSNIEIVPDVDVDAIIEEAYKAGVQAGYQDGFDQGIGTLNDFNPGGWLVNIVEGVLGCEILPIGDGITVGSIFAVLLVIPFAVWFLRLFAGG